MPETAENYISAEALHQQALDLFRLGRLFDASARIYRAIELDPHSAEYHCNLGVVLVALGRSDDAADSFRHATQLRPRYSQALTNLGEVLTRSGDARGALNVLRQAVDCGPMLPEAHYNLGRALEALGRRGWAAREYTKAIELRPEFAEARVSLANVMLREGRPASAIKEYQKVLGARPACAETRFNLAMAFCQAGRLDEGVAHYRRIVEQRPEHSGTWLNLGNTCKDRGDLVEAIEAYRQGLKVSPSSETSSAFLLAKQYTPGYTPAEMARDHNAWARQYVGSFARHNGHPNDRSADRRLKIAYLSSDLRDHPVGRCLLPVLRQHDRRGFDVICYAGGVGVDEVTRAIRGQADGWHRVTPLTDAQLAEKIRADRIDVLVDLSGHTQGNRLTCLARKPAPVQITWLGWPGTTGLEAIDVRLSDPYLDPQRLAAETYAERTIHLPHCFWCYAPPTGSARIGELPALANGYLTFASLNNVCKISDAALDAWAEVLRRTPRSRLCIRAPFGHARLRILDRLRRGGISNERVSFLSKVPRAEYWERFNSFDICLDSFPYNGCVTTLDTLWMGVPVVTCVGLLPVGRAGLSILTNVGLRECVAVSVGDYIRRITDLASDWGRLAELRGTLRGRMMASPISDAANFARDLEAIFRRLWRGWCSGMLESLDYCSNIRATAATTSE